MPAAFRSDVVTPTQSQLDMDLRAILQSLPTRADIEALIMRIEESHNRDIQEVRTKLHTVADLVTSGETLVASLASRVQALELAQEVHTMEAQEMQLHIE